VIAGFFTAACVFAGSFIRPVGGALADRFGGVRTLSVVFALAAAWAWRWPASMPPRPGSPWRC
jgi:nitrate/nitrite transporter NarK